MQSVGRTCGPVRLSYFQNVPFPLKYCIWVNKNYKPHVSRSCESHLWSVHGLSLVRAKYALYTPGLCGALSGKYQVLSMGWALKLFAT